MVDLTQSALSILTQAALLSFSREKSSCLPAASGLRVKVVLEVLNLQVTEHFCTLIQRCSQKLSSVTSLLVRH